MAKIILAVSAGGVLSVASHIPGRGFVMSAASSALAAKWASKYSDTAHDSRSIRLKMDELTRDGWSNVRVDDLSRLPIKDVHSVGIDMESGDISLSLRSPDYTIEVNVVDGPQSHLSGWAE